MNILNVGYGTTNPQTLFHLVQCNVALRLEDPRNNVNSIINIDFKRGSGTFGNTSSGASGDWRLSSSNSQFNIEKHAYNLTSNILSINENGNIAVANDIIIGGNFIKNGNNVITDVSNYINAVDSNLNTIINTTVLTSIDSNNSNVSNYIRAVDSNLNTIINTTVMTNIDSNNSNVSNYIRAVDSNLNTIINTTVLTSIDSNNSNVSNYIRAVDSNLNTIINTTVLTSIDSNNSNVSNYIQAVDSNLNVIINTTVLTSIDSNNSNVSNYIRAVDSNLNVIINTTVLTSIDSNNSNVSNYIRAVDSNLNNVINTTVLTSIDSNNSNVSNYIRAVDSNINTIINIKDTSLSNYSLSINDRLSGIISVNHNTMSNFLLNNSNTLALRIDNITTDEINNGVNNKFIVNNYHNDILNVAGKFNIFSDNSFVDIVNVYEDNINSNSILKILQNGRVGIGNSQPDEKLDVSGNMNITGIYKRNNVDIIQQTNDNIVSSSNVLNKKVDDLSASLFYYDSYNLKISNILLPRATCNNFGAIKPDNITIKIDSNGIISGNLSVDLSSYATKNDLDSVVSGLTFIDPVELATTVNITYPPAGLIQIDGVFTSLNNRVLVKNQNLKYENGIYTASTSTWSRSEDFNSTENIKSGAFVFVKNGNINKNSGYVFNTSNFATLGTDSINFTQFSSAGQTTGGTGIVKDVNAFNLNIKDEGGIEIDGNNQIYVNLGLANISSVLPVAKGGTGSTTLENLINLPSHTTGILPIAKGGTGTNSLNNLINLSSHTTGILPASKGGSGKDILTLNQVIVGNGTGAVIQSDGLTWTNNTLFANNISGNGTGITLLNANNVASGILAVERGGIGASSFNNLINLSTHTNGILPVSKGGTGANNLAANQLIVGNATDAPIQSENLTWNNINSILSATNIAATTLSGSGANITSLSAANISTGTLSIARGGTGVSSFVENQLIVGNGTNVPIQSASLSWNNTTNTLSAANIAGSGENITGLNIDNISAGVLPVSKGGTGVNKLVLNQLVVGNATNTPIQSANLTWNNTTNTLAATNITGNGSLITALNAANISTGTLSIARGGTGTGSFFQNQLIVGNGTNAPIQSASLSWNNTTNTLSATNIAGSGENITGLNIDNISAGVLSVSKGGTGANNLAENQLLVGNAANTPIQSANLTWNNIGNILSATNIEATTLSGSGANITALSAANISTGTLSVSRGGTGTGSFVQNQLIVGNGTNTPIQSASLSWNNTTNTLSATNIAGSGENITGLNIDNISAGVLPVSKGGTGANNLVANQLVVGNATDAPIQSGNLTWNNIGSILSATNIEATTLSGSGANITALSAANISTGTLSVSRGGTGTGSFVQNQLIVGNGTNTPIQSASLLWNNTTNTLSATNIAGSGENITGLNIDNISAGVLPVSKGGTGANNLAANQLLVGNAANTPIQSANLTWNNTTNTLVATNITGNGSLINALNANNISSGTLSIARGGTGSSTLTADIIEQGTVKRFIENDTISMPNIPLNVNKILYMGASIVPTLDNIFSLGSADKKWKDIFVSANTITIGTTTLSASPTGAIEMSSISFADKINLVTSNELHSLTGITKNVQQQINELNLDNIANGAINKYIINNQYQGELTVGSRLNVGSYYSTENQNGNLHVFGDLILEGDVTTNSPFITQIHRNLSNYNTGYIDIYNIDDSSNKPSVKIRHNTGYSNVLECYSKDDNNINNPLFIITSNGNIGIANEIPTEKLDIIGNIKYTGKINNITANEMAHLSGINYNIKQRIADNDIRQSNYVLNISNILNIDYSNRDAIISNFVIDVREALDKKIITSNNILYLYASNNDINNSNYLLSTIINLNNTQANSDLNISNYISATSNEIMTFIKNNGGNQLELILETSNVLFKYSFDNNIYQSNYVASTSNILIAYSSNININLLNYIHMTSNNLVRNASNINVNLTNYILATSNNLIKNTNNVDSNLSNYVLATSNYLINYSITSDKSLSNYVISTSNTLNTNLINFSRNAVNITQGVINSDRLPVATADKKGAIKKGTNLNILSDGTLSVILDVYEGNAFIKGDLITSNLTVLGSSTILDTNVYITERLEIINDSLNNAVDIRQKANGYNIMNISNLTSEVFNIGYNGDITFSDSINNISVSEFAKIANITANDRNVSNYVEAVDTRLSALIAYNDVDTCNYIKETSNVLAVDYNRLNRNASNFVEAVDTRLSALIAYNDVDTCNYIKETSNILVVDYNRLNGNISNYIRVTSNFIVNDYKNRDVSVSNYIDAISNILSINIKSTNDLLISSDVWNKSGNNIDNKNTGNVGIGTTNPLKKLHILQAHNSEGTIDTTNVDIVDADVIVSSMSFPSNRKDAGIMFIASSAVGSANISTPSSFIKSGWTTAGSTAWNKSYIDFNTHATNTTAWTTDMRIQGGKVGIGTTNPTQLLTLNNGNILLTGAWNSSSKYSIQCYNADKRIEFDYVNGTGIFDNNRITFNAGNQRIMNIVNTGSVGIGIDNPTAGNKLHIVGNTITDGNAYITGNLVVNSTLTVNGQVLTTLISTNDSNVSNYIGAVDTRLSALIAYNDVDTCNYIKDTSNILAVDYNRLNGNMSNFVEAIDTRLSALIAFNDVDTSNYIKETSNILAVDYNRLNGNVSNFVEAVDTRLSALIAYNDADTCNYIKETSNILASSINYLYDNSYNDQKTLNVINNGSYLIASNKLQLPIATSAVLGGVKQGTNTSINADGIISVNLSTYTGNAIIDGNLTTSNLTVLGSTTTLDTNVYITERLEIFNDSLDNAVIIKQKTAGYNIINVSNLTSEVFSIGYNGNITFSESINNITKEQFSKIANLTASDVSVSNYVDAIDSRLSSLITVGDDRASNYVRVASNLLVVDYKRLDSNVSNYVGAVDTRISSLITVGDDRASNYVRVASNLLVLDYKRLDSNISNYLGAVDTRISSLITVNDDRASNYVRVASNLLVVDYKRLDSNVSNYVGAVDTRISSLITVGDDRASNYVRVASNLLVVDYKRLDSNVSNYVGAVDTRISSLITVGDDRASNYVRVASNLLVVDYKRLDSNVSNYLGAVDTRISSLITVNDDRASNYVRVASNLLVLDYKRLDSNVSNYVGAVDTRISSLITVGDDRASNYVRVASNLLVVDYKRLDSNVSNYLGAVDTRISSLITVGDDRTSNYVRVASNLLVLDYKRLDSNVSNYLGAVDTRISSLITVGDDRASNYVSVASNVIISTVKSIGYITASTLPKASDVTLGGVKVDGSTITINGSGVISGANTYVLPAATTGALGGVRQGTNTAINASGIISVDLSTYTGNAIINGNLTTSNLTVLGSTTTLDTNVYITERLEIFNDSLNNAVIIKQKTPGYNIMNVSNLTSEVLSVGYNGNITFKESINNITATQFNQIANITTNDDRASNYVRVASNLLVVDYKRLDGNVSNYVSSSSNALVLDYKRLDGNVSNFVRTSASKWTANDGTIYATDLGSNIVIGQVQTGTSGSKFKVYPNSGQNACFFNGSVVMGTASSTSIFWNGLTDTYLARANGIGSFSSSSIVGDVVISSDKNIIIKSGVQSVTPSIYVKQTDGNVGIAKNNPSYTLDVGGTVNCSAILVNGSSIPIYDDTALTALVNTKDLNVSNYVSSSSNALVLDYKRLDGNVSNYVSASSNALVLDYRTLDANVSNYVRAASNYLYNNYSNLIANIAVSGGGTTTIVSGGGGGLSYWKNVTDTTKNSIYYGAPVKIGGDKTVDVANNYIMDIVGNVRVSGKLTTGWSGDGGGASDGGVSGIGGGGGDSYWSAIEETKHIYYTSNVKIGGESNVFPINKLEVAGNISATGVIISGFSDNRLKTITSNINNPMDIISKLNGFYYIPNDIAINNCSAKNKEDVGLSAQDVNKILPHIVNLAPFDCLMDNSNNLISKSGCNYLTVNYEKLAPIFIEAIKTLNEKINYLTNEIEKLKARD